MNSESKLPPVANQQTGSAKMKLKWKCMTIMVHPVTKQTENRDYIQCQNMYKLMNDIKNKDEKIKLYK